MKQKAMAAFKAYTDRYDSSDVKIKLKIDHTYRVADICERIARSFELSEIETDFCWLIGLLHDIGRFEQLKQFGTFIDRDSIDHAELGADILFSMPFSETGKPLIESFIDPSDWLVLEDEDFDGWEEMAKMCETAIRLHNKLTLPDSLDPGTLFYCKLIRSSDKIDIFRVLTEPPYDERNRSIIAGSKDGSIGPARDDIIRCVREHRCVPKTFERTNFESLISQCCMAFELDFPIAWDIAKSQGYLGRLMNLPVADTMMQEQLEILRTEMQKAWEEPSLPEL